MSYDDPIILVDPPGSKPSASVIWLHGLGADGNDFVPIVPHLKLPEDASVGFVFPHAPVRPVTINGGYEMRAWYDILNMTLDREVDLDHLTLSAKYVNSIIDAEIESGVPSDKIIIVGFSQGGAVAIHSALSYPKRLAGLVCLSTYLVGDEQLKPVLSKANQSTPIFWGHGQQDDVVTIDYGQRSSQTLCDWGYDLSWHDYPISHEVSLPEIEQVGQFILDRIES